MKEKYSIEEIHYNLDIARSCLNEKFVSFLCKALTYLDKEIVDKVSEEVLFYNSDISGGSYIPLKSYYTKGRKGIIFLSEFILNNHSEKETIKLILHEIAHFYLGHKGYLITEEENNKQEQEADNLALEWLK